MILTGETEVLEGKPVCFPLGPPQIARGLAWDQMWVSTVRGQQLTTRAMAQPMPCTVVDRCHHFGGICW
jgi:hypothetical protein